MDASGAENPNGDESRTETAPSPSSSPGGCHLVAPAMADSVTATARAEEAFCAASQAYMASGGMRLDAGAFEDDMTALLNHAFDDPSAATRARSPLAPVDSEGLSHFELPTAEAEMALTAVDYPAPAADSGASLGARETDRTVQMLALLDKGHPLPEYAHLPPSPRLIDMTSREHGAQATLQAPAGRIGDARNCGGIPNSDRSGLRHLHCDYLCSTAGVANSDNAGADEGTGESLYNTHGTCSNGTDGIAMSDTGRARCGSDPSRGASTSTDSFGHDSSDGGHGSNVRPVARGGIGSNADGGNIPRNSRGLKDTHASDNGDNRSSSNSAGAATSSKSGAQGNRDGNTRSRSSSSSAGDDNGANATGGGGGDDDGGAFSSGTGQRASRDAAGTERTPDESIPVSGSAGNAAGFENQSAVSLDIGSTGRLSQHPRPDALWADAGTSILPAARDAHPALCDEDAASKKRPRSADPEATARPDDAPAGASASERHFTSIVAQVSLLPAVVPHCTDGRLFACPYENCAKRYAKRSHVVAHMRIHTGECPFTCLWPSCNARFMRSDQLTRHKRQHSGARPFSCFKCGKSFSRSDHLASHMRTHRHREEAGVE